MNEYDDSESPEQTGPIAVPAPTWQWTGTAGRPSTAGHYPTGGWTHPLHEQTPPGQPMPWTQPMQPAYGRARAPRRLRLLGTAAAFLLAAGAAAGGVAFGYAHGQDSSTAAGIAGGGSTSQGALGQSPSQGQVSKPPASGQQNGQQGNGQHGNGQQGGHGFGWRGDGRASRFSTGHATAAQSTGVVDIYTRLKYEGARAAGTGMILTPDGEVLTNNHVVEGATKIKVTVVSTGKKYVATVVGTDKVDDVAVLQLTGASGLSTVTPDTDGIQLGDPVTAVGNAMGAGGVPSAAKGTVVGLNRSITTQSEGGVDGERLTGLIEVDAEVVSGDSGGPLYDSQNEVVGMDTAASSSPAQSTGFAIPIGKALSIAQQMMNGQAGGNINLGSPAFLGVTFTPGAYDQGGKGALVEGVLRNTPAARSGLIAGDRIVSVDGTAITSGEQLRTVLSNYSPGQTASITWTDTQGGSHTASIKLMAGPAE